MRVKFMALLSHSLADDPITGLLCHDSSHDLSWI